MEQQQKKPDLAILRELEVGEMHAFPLTRLASIKSSCTTFGLQWDKRFQTKINRENKSVDVTRIA